MNSSFADTFIRYTLAAQPPITVDDYVLGMHCIGADISTAKQRLPTQHISTPILNDINPTLYELWHTDSICRSGQFADITFRCNDTLLFGVIEIDEATFQSDREQSTLRAVTEHAYGQIFSLLDAEGFNNLWRTWNYVPNIHADECGLERYRQFNIGRHNAFVGCEKSVDNCPAASALGTHGGIFSIAFIAGRTEPTRIENPRQVSAFDYPSQYGPRSPTFTRAVTVTKGNHEALFISGTASIVGHATVHHDDVAAQTQETVANLAALLTQANADAQQPPFTLKDMYYRIYIRHPTDIKKVHETLDTLIGKSICATYVQAEICRKDLLIEVEAFATRSLTPNSL